MTLLWQCAVIATLCCLVIQITATPYDNSKYFQVITQKLLSNNANLESFQVQNNSIQQIESDFYKGTKIMRADFSSNLCISESITLAKFIQWSSILLKFKNCFNNYALMKSTDESIQVVKLKMDELETKVAEMVDKVDNDMKILENKMENATDFQEFKTNLVKVFKDDQKKFEEKFQADLSDISSNVRLNLTDVVKKNVVEVLEKSQEANQEKLVKDDFADLRSEFSGKFTLIYVTLFFMICFACIAAFFIIRSQSIYPIFSRYQSDSNKLIEAEVC